MWFAVLSTLLLVVSHVNGRPINSESAQGDVELRHQVRTRFVAPLRIHCDAEDPQGTSSLSRMSCGPWIVCRERNAPFQLTARAPPARLARSLNSARMPAAA